MDGNCKHVTDLSDEILLEIVSYINIGDVVNLAATCSRFDRLLQDITICRRIVIPWNCGALRQPVLRFLMEPNRALIVTQLTLNDVYWIPSFNIRDVVLKMQSLQELHVAGTSLSWNHLSQILEVSTLNSLSWTWDDTIEALIRPRRDRMPQLPYETIWAELLALKDKFRLLRFLLIHVRDAFNSTQLIVSSYCSLCYLISMCTNLEELWIFSNPKTNNERKHSLIYRKEEFHPEMQFPRLHTFVLSANEPVRIHVPTLTFRILKSFQLKDGTSLEEERPTGDLVRNLWIDHSLLDLDLCRPRALILGNYLHRRAEWPSLNCQALERFCLPLVDEVLKMLDPSDLKSCKHLFVTHGYNRIISLNRWLHEASHLESFRSTAFNYRMDWEEFVQSHPLLTAINVSEAAETDDGVHSYPGACVQIGSLAHLRKLSLPLYCLFEIKSPTVMAEYLQKLTLFDESNEDRSRNLQVLEGSASSSSALTSEHFGKKRRESRQPYAGSKATSISGLDYVTLCCPNIDEFEIGFTRREAGAKLLTASLSSIGRWTNLKRLTLDGVPVVTGQFLVDIAKRTPSLESLRIKDLGPAAKCVYINSLYVALKYLRKLKDFRLEQKYIGSLNPLFGALESCPELERLFIYSPSNDRPLEISSGIFDLVTTCRKLSVIYITLGSATKGACHYIRKQLESMMYKTSRPALNVVIQNNMEEDVVQFQSVHYRDLVCFSSSVCSYHSFPVDHR